MQEILWVVSNITPAALVDITIVALVFFTLTLSLRGRQAATLLRGILILFVGLFAVATLLRLQGLSWLLNNTFTALIVAIPLIFQNELRAMFERIGRGRLLFTRYAPEDVRVTIIDEIVKTTEKLCERRHGALIVLQRYSNLEEFIATGVRVDSIVKSELLLTIFWPKTELHDGAVIVTREGILASAAAVLPLTASRNLPTPKTGTRHRAAVGISEVSDATCVVVSEETGRVSVAQNGRLIMKVESERLRAMLLAAYEDSFGERPTGLRASIRAWWQARQAKIQEAQGS